MRSNPSQRSPHLTTHIMVIPNKVVSEPWYHRQYYSILHSSLTISVYYSSLDGNTTFPKKEVDAQSTLTNAYPSHFRDRDHVTSNIALEIREKFIVLPLGLIISRNKQLKLSHECK
mgnify:CR=1 FL=1